MLYHIAAANGNTLCHTVLRETVNPLSTASSVALQATHTGSSKSCQNRTLCWLLIRLSLRASHRGVDLPASHRVSACLWPMQVYQGGIGSYALFVMVAAFLLLHPSRHPRQPGSKRAGSDTAYFFSCSEQGGGTWKDLCYTSVAIVTSTMCEVHFKPTQHPSAKALPRCCLSGQ